MFKESSAERSRCTCHVWKDLHALIMNNIKHRVLRIKPNNTSVQSVLVGVLNLHLDKKS